MNLRHAAALALLNHLFATALCIVAIAGCDRGGPVVSNQPSTEAQPPAAALAAELFIQPSASRGSQGEIVIEGRTNLPDGLVIGVELYNGKKLAGQDFKVKVNGGQFRSTGFTNRNSPYAPGRYRVHFLSFFNGAWQSTEILALVGDGGSRLRGKLFKLTDPDVVDSDRELDLTATLSFPPLSQEAKAIALVKAAVLTGGGFASEGRSSANVGKTVAWYMTMPDLTPNHGWSARRIALGDGQASNTYMVVFDYIDGPQGERQAVWTANLATGEVHFTNKAAKAFSWMPPD